MINSISIIIPSFHTKNISNICINSIEKYKPKWLNIKYIVIENSNEKNYINLKSSNVIWINNIISITGSEANASAIVKGLNYVDTEVVMICHSDTCINASFFESIFKKYSEGNVLIGTVLDPIRIKAVHISGLIVKSDIAKKVDYYPVYKNNIQIMDVGDQLTKYCTDNNLKFFCFSNTFNKNVYNIDNIDKKFKDFNVDRCVDGENVIFLHLGRGTPKTNGTYYKENAVTVDQWEKFCLNNIL
jgi:hypothetical protein